jgi:predicted ABC-type ATPase
MANSAQGGPRIVIIAGPNGAGKTTFAREFLPNEAECPDFLNADLMAAGLSPIQPAAAAARARRLVLEEIHGRLRAGRSFAIGTTLSGRAYAGAIPEWRRAGYRVKLIFLRLARAELAIARVAARAAQGGHAAPEAAIRRRFETGWLNFERLYKPLADCWMLFENSAEEPRLFEQRRNPANAPPPAFADRDMEGAEAALRRAARRARELGERTGTPVCVLRGMEVVDLTAAKPAGGKLKTGGARQAKGATRGARPDPE